MTIFSMKNTINTKDGCYKFEKLNFHAKIIYFFKSLFKFIGKTQRR